VELLQRAELAARRFNRAACIRLVPEAPDGVRFELTDEALPGDSVVEHEAGFTLIVAPGLSGRIDVADPHDRLVLIPDDVDTSGTGR
jgi:hypothetical protein